jgi:hypothetical protein
VNLLWQAIGLAVCIAAGLATGWVMSAILERTTGLVESEDVQVAGYDARYWDIVHDSPAAAVPAVVTQAPDVLATTGREPEPTAGPPGA